MEDIKAIRKVILQEIKKVLNEKREASLFLMDMVESATEANDHNEARRLVAQSLKDKQLTAAYEGMKAINQAFRSMPQSAIQLRSELDKQLYAKASRRFSNVDELWSLL